MTLSAKTRTQDLEFLRETEKVTATLAEREIRKPCSAKDWLSKDELIYYHSVNSSTRQAEYLAGRIAAKEAVAQQFQIQDASEISINTGIMKHPIVAHPKAQNAVVSISHSKEKALAVASTDHHPVCIDCESLPNQRDKTIAALITKDEAELLSKYPVLKQHQNSIIWTAKESLSKFLKTGMAANKSLYHIKSITQLSDREFSILFSHFFELKASCIIEEDQVLSLCYPRQSTLKPWAVIS